MAKEIKMADEKILTIPLSKIASELAEKHEMSKKAAGEFLGAFVDLTVKNLKKGHKVRVTGLGIFQVKKRPARLGRNPATGEQIKIKASKKLAFRAAKEVKDAI
jgi:DNA-binding protein HU-beta